MDVFDFDVAGGFLNRGTLKEIIIRKLILHEKAQLARVLNLLFVNVDDVHFSLKLFFRCLEVLSDFNKVFFTLVFSLASLFVVDPKGAEARPQISDLLIKLHAECLLLVNS